MGGHPKKFVRPFGPQFGLRIRGGAGHLWAPPVDPPLHCHGKSLNFLHCELDGISLF